MDCKKAKRLLAPHYLGDLDDEPRLCSDLQAHLSTCPDCTDEYEGFAQTIGFIQDHKTEFAHAFANARATAKATGVVERPRLFQVLSRMGAVAAGVAIGLFLWMVFSDPYKPQTRPQYTTSNRPVTSISGTPVKVELITPSGNISVEAGLKIVADNELKTLLISNKHRLVMNRHTTLSIDPLISNDKLGCLVGLQTGRIYAEVEPDGKPFEVHFAHGKAVITGTTFDINTQGQTTTLIVSEGSVHFGSDKGAAVQVTAGMQSVIVNNGIPSQPAQCPAEQLMAWATGEKQPEMTDPLSGQEFNSLINELPLPVSYPGQSIDLESLDYDLWVEEKREWFGGQFPWIFQILRQLETGNQQPATNLDYPDLLIQTGDIWQIVYPERMYRVIPVMNVDAVQSITKEHGIDRTSVIGGATSVGQSYRKQPELAFGLAALEEWSRELKTLQWTCDSEGQAETIREHSYVMGQYLQNSRTLLWLCVRNGRYKIEPAYKAALCDHLKQQIALASACKRAVVDMTRSGATEGAVSGKYYNKCVELTARIIECEKAMQELIYNLRSDP